MLPPSIEASAALPPKLILILIRRRTAAAASTPVKSLAQGEPTRPYPRPRAPTKKVELAGLKYQASHLVKGANSGYDRQRGGLGAVGGSGEKAIETQRRLLRDRTAEVNRLLKDVERRRGYQRGARDRRLEPTVALVGYTNVGKSSLLNELALGRHSRRASMGGGDGGESGGESGVGGGGGGLDDDVGTRSAGVGRGKGMVHARNRLFDTLDPTVRSVSLPSRTRWVRFPLAAVLTVSGRLPWVGLGWGLVTL